MMTRKMLKYRTVGVVDADDDDGVLNAVWM